MWAAIAAAALKRFLAHMTQLLAEVPMSTRKVAMCAIHVLGNLVEALKRGNLAGLYAALETAITYLACHAQRAHPKRDRQTGRAQLGLEPYFENDGMIKLAPFGRTIRLARRTPWYPHYIRDIPPWA